MAYEDRPNHDHDKSPYLPNNLSSEKIFITPHLLNMASGVGSPYVGYKVVNIHKYKKIITTYFVLPCKVNTQPEQETTLKDTKDWVASPKYYTEIPAYIIILGQPTQKEMSSMKASLKPNNQ